MAIQDDLERESARLESVFFAGESASLLEELRRDADEDRLRDVLRGVVKIKDEAFIGRLVALGIRPATALALALVPLVLVAWADGALDDREREAILRAAKERGLTSGDMARRLLQSSLSRQPDARLFPLWTAYVRTLWGCFTPDERWTMRQNALRSTREVAEAAGGFLGLTSKVSDAERRVLDEMDRLLD